MMVTAVSIIGWSDDLLPEILVHLPVKTLLSLKIYSMQKMEVDNIRCTVRRQPIPENPYQLCFPGSFRPISLPPRSIQTIASENRLPSVIRKPPASVLPLTFINEFPLDFPYYRRYVQSCNGLLLCIFFNDFYGDDARSCLAICKREISKSCQTRRITLVFNPFESHHYSIVAIKRSLCVNMPRLGPCELYIFSSETERWEFRRMIDGVEMYSHSKGWFSNGTVYWIGRNLIHYYNVNSNEIGNLDLLAAEITGTTNMIWHSSYFGRGRLYIVKSDWILESDDWNHRYREFKIFEFDNVNMKWSNLCIELLNVDHFENNKVPHNTSPLAVVRGKEEKDFLIVFAAIHPYTFMIFDLVLHKLIQTHAVEFSFSLKSCDYIPSLVHV